jgi:hypothetical protein
LLGSDHLVVSAGRTVEVEQPMAVPSRHIVTTSFRAVEVVLHRERVDEQRIEAQSGMDFEQPRERLLHQVVDVRGVPVPGRGISPQPRRQVGHLFGGDLVVEGVHHLRITS